MKAICEFVTGSRRGYIHVACRGVESDFYPVPDTLTGLRGNERKAMLYFQATGATCYTVASYQGVPFKGYSNQFCYTVYTGYKNAT